MTLVKTEKPWVRGNSNHCLKMKRNKTQKLLDIKAESSKGLAKCQNL